MTIFSASGAPTGSDGTTTGTLVDPTGSERSTSEPLALSSSRPENAAVLVGPDDGSSRWVAVVPAGTAALVGADDVPAYPVATGSSCSWAISIVATITATTSTTAATMVDGPSDTARGGSDNGADSRTGRGGTTPFRPGHRRRGSGHGWAARTPAGGTHHDVVLGWVLDVSGRR